MGALSIEEYLPGFLETLADAGFSRSARAHSKSLVRKFGVWIEGNNRRLSDLTDEDVGGYVKDCTSNGEYRTGLKFCLRRLLQFLRAKKVVNSAPSVELSRTYPAVARYCEYLEKVKGSCGNSLRNACSRMTSFLNSRREPRASLATLTPAEIQGFIESEAQRVNKTTASASAMELRRFLRHLYFEKVTVSDLSGSVPKVAAGGRRRIPKFISRADVSRMLRTFDCRRSAADCRNYAMLFLMARLGLRGCEVRNLTLDDIDWDNRLIRVRGKGSERQLPLPAGVDLAIARYIKRWRPKCADRSVFLKVNAPIGKLSTHGPLSVAVAQAVRKSGVSAPIKGSSLLRHSFATDMLSQEVPLEDIGRVLGHAHPDTTMTYAKTETRKLRTMAFPWPIRGRGSF